MSAPTHKNRLKRWLTRYVPGTYRNNHLCFDESTWLQGIRTSWWRFVQWMPLLTLLRPSWWWSLRQDDRRTCGCGRTWFQYRILPALVGDKRFGGGC